MGIRGVLALLLIATAGITSLVHAQGVRARMRPKVNTITASQATELTLTLTAVAVRPLQVWVRTAGTIDTTGKIITTYVGGSDAQLLQAGQRARAFPVESRSSMYQARVVRVVAEQHRSKVDVELVASGRPSSRTYVVEIVTEPAWYLSVPNEAIIEEGDRRVAYVQTGEGQYEPRTVKTGVQGELYTQVLDGVKPGDQVVTFGSFFIDADYKLKGASQAAGSR